MGPMDGCLCIGCLEKRLGRVLRPKDFKRGHPFNTLPGTPRLIKRQGRILPTVTKGAHQMTDRVLNIDYKYLRPDDPNFGLPLKCYVCGAAEPLRAAGTGFAMMLAS